MKHFRSTVSAVVLIAGIIPNVPGFLTNIQLVSADLFPAWLNDLYHYAWFIGFAVSGIVYRILNRAIS